MAETPTTFPAALLAEFNPEKKFKCDPGQWQEIITHHQRVLAVFETVINHPDKSRFLFLLPNENDLEEIRLAIAVHDIGKALVDKDIHDASKTDTMNMKEYDEYYKDHPAQALNLLGKDFCDKHPLAAAIILSHHPNGIQDSEWQIPEGLKDTDAFRWGLAMLIAVDGLTAGHEPTRYRRQQSEKAEVTIDILRNKLENHSLSGFFDVEALVVIGYQTLNQLGF